MSHLATRPRFLFSVEVQRSGPGKRLPGTRLRPDNIFHHRIGMAARAAKRPSGHGADMLLELGTGAGFDGPMTTIMDARRDLVDQQCAIGPDKQLHREDTHVIKSVPDP